MLKAFFKNTPLSFFILTLSGLVIYALLPLVFYPSLGFYRAYYLISKIVLGILICVMLAYFPMLWYIRRYYASLPTKKMHSEHLAIIIIKYDIMYKTFFYLLIHLKRLFQILTGSNIPYTVSVVKNEKELVETLTDKKVKAVFIWGHGQRHGVKFGNEVYPYCNLPKISHIKFVGQFHCNHYSGRSLQECIQCYGILPDGVTISYELNEFIDSKKYIPELKKLFKVK